MKNLFYFITGVILLSSCLTYTEGQKLEKSNAMDIQNTGGSSDTNFLTELPDVLMEKELKNMEEDETVKTAVLAEYTKRRDSNGTVRYFKKKIPENEGNKQTILDYLNLNSAESQKPIPETLPFILESVLNFYGTPAFYEYNKSESRLNVNYIYESSFFFTLGVITIGKKKYVNNQFIFDINPKNPYNSALVSFKEDVFSGKYYGTVQPPIYDFLNSFNVPVVDNEDIIDHEE